MYNRNFFEFSLYTFILLYDLAKSSIYSFRI